MSDINNKVINFLDDAYECGCISEAYDLESKSEELIAIIKPDNAELKAQIDERLNCTGKYLHTPIVDANSYYLLMKIKEVL